MNFNANLHSNGHVNGDGVHAHVHGFLHDDDYAHARVRLLLLLLSLHDHDRIHSVHVDELVDRQSFVPIISDYNANQSGCHARRVYAFRCGK